jgi:hypothetical protein
MICHNKDFLPPRGSMVAKRVTRNGITYRSQMEARIAILLETIGADPQYETESYAIPGGYYRPDFFCANWYRGVWVEAKPESSLDADYVKARKFAAFNIPRHQMLLMLIGSILNPQYEFRTATTLGGVRYACLQDKYRLQHRSVNEAFDRKYDTPNVSHAYLYGQSDGRYENVHGDRDIEARAALAQCNWCGRIGIVNLDFAPLSGMEYSRSQPCCDLPGPEKSPGTLEIAIYYARGFNAWDEELKRRQPA